MIKNNIIKTSIAALLAAMLVIQFHIGLFPLYDNRVYAQETANSITEKLVIWELPDAENAIAVGWNEAENLSEITEKYQLILYKKDNAIAVETVEIAFQNNVKNDLYDYEYVFYNIAYNQEYYCALSQCDSEGNWSDYIISESIKLSKDSNPRLEINTSKWTDNTAPKLTWSGVYLDTENVIEIQYQINDGEWQKSDWISESGSEKLNESIFAADGEYRIKIRGKSYIINEKTGESEEVFTEASNEVLYKRDADAPQINIISPKSADEVPDKVKIVGTIEDGGSGISSWKMEYESNNNPDVWIEIARGNQEISKKQTISTWDTSKLQAGFYTIRLTVCDNDKNSSKSTYSVTIQKTDKATPMVPINLKAILISDTSISAEISWEFTQKPMQTTYNIYRSTDIEFTDIELVAADVDDTYWIDKEIYYGETYYYKVTAVIDSKESKLSTECIEVRLDKKLGLEDNYTYADFNTDKGTGYINLANGNLVYCIEDSIYTNLLEGISFSRVYNSQSDIFSPIGYGWDFSFNICLYQEKDIDNNLLGMILKDSDGSLHYFEYDSALGGYISPNNSFVELEYSNKTGQHILTREDDTIYTFGDDLKLIQIAIDDTHYVSLQYDINGNMIVLENNAGEKILLDYYQDKDKEGLFCSEDIAHVGLLAQITDKEGKNYVYEYLQDQPILSMVSLGTTAYRERYYYADDGYNLTNIFDTAKSNVYLEYSEKQNELVKLFTQEELLYEIFYEESFTLVMDKNNDIKKYTYGSNGSLIYKEEKDKIHNEDFKE